MYIVCFKEYTYNFLLSGVWEWQNLPVRFFLGGEVMEVKGKMKEVRYHMIKGG